MSDSSLSSVTPSQAALEQALRNAVERVYRLGNLEELTVKRIRAAVEQDLDLEEDFFKTNGTWKEKSKNIIQSEVVRTNKCTPLGSFVMLIVSLGIAYRCPFSWQSLSIAKSAQT